MINFHRGSCKMELLRNFLVFCLCIVAANAQAKFYVLSSTSPSLSFEGNSKLKSGEVGAVAVASTGLSISDTCTWDALHIEDPFDLPTLAVVVHIEGAPKIAFKSAQHTFNSEGNAATAALESVVKTVASVACDVNFNKNDEAVAAMKQCFSDIVVPEIVPVDGLNADIAEDKAVLDAVAGINAMADAATALTATTEILIVRFSLQALKKLHATEQASIDAAVTALETALEKFQTDFVADKGSKVAMFAIVTEGVAEKPPTTDAPITGGTDDTTTEAGNGEETPAPKGEETDTNSNESEESLRRKKREAVEGSTTNPYNLAVYYNQDYPVIFNIILWFMVTFGFSLLAICYAIGDMDPGRDSIIYRMTSTRMKKDN